MKRTVLLVFAILYIAFTNNVYAQKKTVDFYPVQNPEIQVEGITPTGQQFTLGFYFGEKRIINESKYYVIIGWEKGRTNGYDFLSDSLGHCIVTIKEGDSILVNSKKLKIPFNVCSNGALRGVFLDPRVQRILTIEIAFNDTDYSTKEMTVVTQQFTLNFDKNKLETVVMPVPFQQLVKSR